MEGFYYRKKDQFIERVHQNSGSLALLAKTGEFEVMEFVIHEGKEFIILPAENSEQLVEFFYVMEGIIDDETHHETYLVGDIFYVNKLKAPVFLKATTTTKLLYVINESLFFMMSEKMKKLKQTIIKVEEKDIYTDRHSHRVMEYSMLLAKRLHLKEIDLSTLSYAALFHDLGKIDIPIEILQKPSKLTNEEYERIKQHPILGRVLADEIQLISMGEIIEQHHERLDGSGYPNGLKGDQIRIEAKIISLVDCFDAMTSDRAYRKSMTVEAALAEIIKYRGIHYDEQLVDAFIEILHEQNNEKIL